MNIFTVSLFGHREIDDLQRLNEALAPIIKELMRKKLYVTFLIGRNGEFDEYAAMKYAKKLNKDITNLYTREAFSDFQR